MDIKKIISIIEKIGILAAIVGAGCTAIGKGYELKNSFDNANAIETKEQ